MLARSQDALLLSKIPNVKPMAITHLERQPSREEYLYGVVCNNKLLELEGFPVGHECGTPFPHEAVVEEHDRYHRKWACGHWEVQRPWICGCGQFLG